MGMWIDNADGTSTAQQDDTLWGKYGADWQEKSGYTGDPTKLQPGDVVGKADNWSKSDYSLPEDISKAEDVSKTTETDSTIKIRVYGGIWALSGVVVAGFSGANLVALKNKEPESVSDASAKAFVLGVQMFLLGGTQAASGKQVMPSQPLNFFKPLIYDLYQEFTNTIEENNFSIDKLRS